MAEKKRGRDYWLDFFRRFDKSKLPLAGFCQREKVALKTAQNWASKLKKEREAGNIPEGGEQGREKQGNGEYIPAASNEDESSNDAASNSKESGADPDPVALPLGGEEIGRAPNPGWANLIPARKGEQRALKHGAYAQYLPPDVRDEVNSYGRESLRDVTEEIRLTKGRLIMVQQQRAQWDSKAEYGELRDNDYQLNEIAVSEIHGRATKRIRPEFELHEDKLTRRLAWLMQVQEQLSRRITMTADEAVIKRAAIIARGREEGWSYSTMGLEIELLGLEVPFTLQQLIRNELDLIEPEEPDNGLTDDELEALSEEYDEQLSGEDEWLKERRQAVKGIHDDKAAENVAE